MPIWKHAESFNPRVDPRFQISLGEGNTPCEENRSLSKSLRLEKIFLKREDLNPTGSHKDRSLAYQISAHQQRGRKEFIISSSGNAAISAAAICQKAGLTLHIFLSPKTSHPKLRRLGRVLKYEITPNENIHEETTFSITFSPRPLSDAFRYSKESGIIFLRSSKDPLATEGLKTISFELKCQVPKATQIFIPTSSGTTAAGVYEGYRQLLKKEKFTPPQIHIVQTTQVHPIAREFDRDFIPEESSLAEAIVDRVAHRKPQVVDAIADSGGYGWIVSNGEIQKASNLLKKSGVICSPEGAMTVAALIKARSRNPDLPCPVCLITGTAGEKS